MLYWLLALPARYGTVASLAVTMCVLNTLAIIGCVALARRRGGYVLMFAAAFGISLMCQSLPERVAARHLEPAGGLFPFLPLLFVGWSLACGEYRLLPLAALLASFVVQTHLMYLAPTLVVLAVGLPACWCCGRCSCALATAPPGDGARRMGRRWRRWQRRRGAAAGLAMGAGGGRRARCAAGPRRRSTRSRNPGQLHDDRPHGGAPGAHARAR